MGSLAEDLACDLWLGFFSFGSMAWDLWLWIFGSGSLALDLWLWTFGFRSLAWDLWLGILRLGNWDAEAGGNAVPELEEY